MSLCHLRVSSLFLRVIVHGVPQENPKTPVIESHPVNTCEVFVYRWCFLAKPLHYICKLKYVGTELGRERCELSEHFLVVIIIAIRAVKRLILFIAVIAQ